MTDTAHTAETTESGHPEAETIRYTADVVAMRPDGSVLLIERGKPPYAGLLALPGGHVDKGERALAAAVRELHEETGVLVDAADLVFVGVYDAPDRDPRGRYVGVAYLARVPADTQARAGDDAASVHWLQPEDMPEQVAFDHRLVVTDALSLVSEH
ncbi:NUDIX hydrolase [Kitasatospora cineracea]|uniref:NUDIX hydrolase n=1 Tax=Kitasatospora cineracea TaxID=88074 RepID=UPI00340C194A